MSRQLQKVKKEPISNKIKKCFINNDFKRFKTIISFTNDPNLIELIKLSVKHRCPQFSKYLFELCKLNTTIIINFIRSAIYSNLIDIVKTILTYKELTSEQYLDLIQISFNKPEILQYLLEKSRVKIPNNYLFQLSDISTLQILLPYMNKLDLCYLNISLLKPKFLDYFLANDYRLNSNQLDQILVKKVIDTRKNTIKSILQEFLIDDLIAMCLQYVNFQYIEETPKCLYNFNI